MQQSEKSDKLDCIKKGGKFPPFFISKTDYLMVSHTATLSMATLSMATVSVATVSVAATSVSEVLLVQAQNIAHTNIIKKSFFIVLFIICF